MEHHPSLASQSLARACYWLWRPFHDSPWWRNFALRLTKKEAAQVTGVNFTLIRDWSILSWRLSGGRGCGGLLSSRGELLGAAYRPSWAQPNRFEPALVVAVVEAVSVAPTCLQNTNRIYERACTLCMDSQLWRHTLCNVKYASKLQFAHCIIDCFNGGSESERNNKTNNLPS